MPKRIVDTGDTISLAEIPSVPVPTPTDIPVEEVQPLLPAQYNLVVYRGDTYEWQFEIFAIDGNPVDIKDWRFKAEIRTAVDGQLMASMNEMSRDDAAGRIVLRLTNDQTRQLTSDGEWDLEAITNDGWVRTVLFGTVTVEGDVTTGYVNYGENYQYANRGWGA